MRFVPAAHQSLIFAVLLLAFCLGDAPVFGDPDTAWHLAAGQLMRLLHGIPVHDPWSFTADGERWYNLSWLFDIIFSFLFDVGGFPLLYMVTVVTFALCLTIMAGHCIRRGASISLVFLSALLVMFIMYVGVLARPNLCSTGLSLAFYLLLQRYRTSGRMAYLAMLPVLMAFWVNLHGGFLLAFLLMGFFLAEALVEKDRPRTRILGAVIAACLAATLINPYGLEIFYGAFRSLTDSFDKNAIREWKPVAIGEHVPMTAMLLLFLWVGNAYDKRILLADRMLAVGLLLFSLTSVRHTIIVSMLLLPYITLRLSHALYASRYGERLRAIDASIMNDMQKQDVRIQLAAMAVVTALTLDSEYPRVALLFMPYVALRLATMLYEGAIGRRLRGIVLQTRPRIQLRPILIDAAFIFLLFVSRGDIMEMKEPSGFPEKYYPVKEAAFVADHYPARRFLNDYNIGGYLDYLWHGRVKVFIDGRASSLYSEEVLDDYRDYMDDHGYGGRAEVILSQYKIDGLIILNSDKNIGQFQWNPQWKSVYRGEVATVFLRNK